eukprot:ctg_342.g235
MSPAFVAYGAERLLAGRGGALRRRRGAGVVRGRDSGAARPELFSSAVGRCTWGRWGRRRPPGALEHSSVRRPADSPRRPQLRMSQPQQRPISSSEQRPMESASDAGAIEPPVELAVGPVPAAAEVEAACANIMRTELGAKVAYLGPVIYFNIEQALVFAYQALHRRAAPDAESPVRHAVAVAAILAELQMDADTVIAALLYDVVEERGTSVEQIAQMFGKDVARLVEGEAKVSKLPRMADARIADEQMENLRQMFIAMTSDFRIIVIKLADRLQQMRSLGRASPPQQEQIARETLDIFAPLAHRLGIWSVKSELENLAFRFLYPDEYRRIRSLIEGRMPTYKRILEESKQQLEQALSEDVILRRVVKRIEVAARSKELYSIWQKVQRGKGQRLDQIYDLVALRVTLEPRREDDDDAFDARSAEEQGKRKEDESSLCYYVLGIVHQLWHPVPGRVKDYIAFPKPNGYQSLHTTVVVNGGREQAPLEVQIRTREMDRMAEYGMAAHWYFKEQHMQMASTNTWLRSISEWSEDVKSSREFVELVRRELLGNRVFVFVNDGALGDATRILNLPRGSSVVDVAFAIHADVGLRMIAAKVNGTMVPMNYVVQNADLVQIVKSKYSPGPSIEWMQYAKTRVARSALRHFFTHVQSSRQFMDEAWGSLAAADADDAGVDAEVVLPAEAEDASASGMESSTTTTAADDTAAATLAHQASAAADFADEAPMRTRPSEETAAGLVPTACADGTFVRADGSPLLHAKLARCCYPLPGDEVFAYQPRAVSSPLHKCTVHRMDCAHGQRLLAQRLERCDTGIRWHAADAVERDAATPPRYPACIQAVCVDRNGLLSDVSGAIIDQGVKILLTRSASSDKMALLEFCVEVTGSPQLRQLSESLYAVRGVVRIERMGSSAPSAVAERPANGTVSEDSAAPGRTEADHHRVQ